MQVWDWILEVWNGFAAGLPHNWDATPAFLIALAETSWVRWIGLLLIVYVTIRIIASVYSGDRQNTELGPVALRPHVARRFGDETIRMSADLMPMNMEGVAAHCSIYYVYSDARGRRRKVRVHKIANSRLSVSPVRIPRIQNMVFGQEIPDAPTEHVCFPPVDVDENDMTIPPTPERASDYAALHKLIEKWTEDDNAPTVTVSTDVLDEIRNGKVEFINDAVRRQQKAKANFVSRNLQFRRLHQNRPNVIGSYYLKFEFSHDPWFVLTRHPDKDLKMTAWLTVLTSMFAMIMEAWPHDRGFDMRAEARPAHTENPPSVTPKKPPVTPH